MNTHDTIAQAHMDISRTAVEAGRQRRTPPDEPFAIVIDRLYDGEGPSLAYWNGENYQFTDGDCYEREGDTLDGYTAEFLTDYQLEERLFDDRKRRGEPVSKTDWNNELSSWSDEDFIRIFHEHPDLADRLRNMLADPVKVPNTPDAGLRGMRNEHGQKN